jgi:probable tail fiber protein (fragment)|nr:MAG TPA: Baseplate structural protein [Caudoviricetes sp.]
MAIYNKPDENVFASSARQGEVSNFPDIGRGWGISFDQTGGIPPMEWFNFLFKRTDEKFGYLFQRGLSEWSATQSYPEGALVQYKNLTYKAKRANTNKKPDEAQSSDWQRWGFTQSELGVATLTGSGVTQLLTSINSNDETKSATPKSVKMAYDKGVEAKTAADNAQRTANDGVSRANNAQRSADNANTNANGRVSKSGDTIDGYLRLNGQNGDWSKLQFGAQKGVWELEVHPESHNVANRRFNMKYNGDSTIFLAFPTIGDNGDTVAYRSWVEDRQTPWGKISDKPAYATRWPNAVEQGYSHSLGRTGWTKLPSGLIIQWGEVNGMGVHKFPIAFNSIGQVFICERSYSDDGEIVVVRDVNNTSFRAWARRDMGAFLFFAIGS